jgi:hypothetical protein
MSTWHETWEDCLDYTPTLPLMCRLCSNRIGSQRRPHSNEKLRGKGPNSISKFHHHNINEGAVCKGMGILSYFDGWWMSTLFLSLFIIYCSFKAFVKNPMTRYGSFSMKIEIPSLSTKGTVSRDFYYLFLIPSNSSDTWFAGKRFIVEYLPELETKF